MFIQKIETPIVNFGLGPDPHGGILVMKNSCNKWIHYISLWEKEKSELIFVKYVQKVAFQEEIDFRK